MVPLRSWFSRVSHMATSGTLVTPSVIIMMPLTERQVFLLCKALATLYPSLQGRHINYCHVVQNHSLKTFKSSRKRSLCVFYVTAFTCSLMKLNVKKQMYAEFQPLYFYSSHKYTCHFTEEKLSASVV